MLFLFFVMLEWFSNFFLHVWVIFQILRKKCCEIAVSKNAAKSAKCREKILCQKMPHQCWVSKFFQSKIANFSRFSSIFCLKVAGWGGVLSYFVKVACYFEGISRWRGWVCQKTFKIHKVGLRASYREVAPLSWHVLNDSKVDKITQLLYKSIQVYSISNHLYHFLDSFLCTVNAKQTVNRITGVYL